MDYAPKLPINEIRSLSRWILVAIGARCVRRVLPVLLKRDSELESTHTQELLDALKAAEDLATGGLQASRASIMFERPRARYSPKSDVATAVLPALALARAAMRDDYAEAVDLLLDVFVGCTDPGWVGGNKFADQLAQEIWRDVALAQQSSTSDLTDGDTPAPPEFFGPLWPKGEPEGWPTDATPERERRRGTVVSIGPSDLFIEFGPKELGVCGVDNWEEVEKPRVGDEIEVFVDRYDESEALSICSWVGADAVVPVAEQAPEPEGEARMRLRIPVLPIEDTPENRAKLKQRLRALLRGVNLVNLEHGGPGLEIASATLTTPSRSTVPTPSGGGS